MTHHSELKFTPESCRILDISDDVLHLRQRLIELRIRFWPRPLVECRKKSTGKWRPSKSYGDQLLALWLHVRPTSRTPDQNRFLFDLYTEDRHPRSSLERIAELLISQIPEKIRHFLKHTKDSPWQLLAMAGASRGVKDLMLSNPMLLKLWLDTERDPSGSFRTGFIPYLDEPQAKQLKRLELPSAKSWVKFVRKIPPEEARHLSLSDFKMLAQVNDTTHLRYLQHRRYLSAYEIRAAYGFAINKSFSRNLGDCEQRALFRLILGPLRNLPKPHKLRLPDSLNQFLSDAERVLLDSKAPRDPLDLKNWRSQLSFRCPAGWQHLDSIEKITQEGEAQNNCLTNPHGYLVEDVYLFKITSPIRATACIRREPCGTLKISECLGPSNHRIGWEPMSRIRAAFNDSGQSQL